MLCLRSFIISSTCTVLQMDVSVLKSSTGVEKLDCLILRPLSSSRKLRLDGKIEMVP